VRTTTGFVVVIVSIAGLAGAAPPPCSPCAGLTVDDPGAVVRFLEQAEPLPEEAQLFVLWPVPLDGTADLDVLDDVFRVGAEPVLRLELTVGPSLADEADLLLEQLDLCADIARRAADGTRFQIAWTGDIATYPVEYAYLLKRAAVSINGARPGSEIVTAPLPEDEALLRTLWGEEIAAYVDAIAIRAGENAALAMRDVLDELDPGKPVVLDSLPLPDPPARGLALAAEAASRGVTVTLFRPTAPLEAAAVAPLRELAEEFSGDLSYDPYALGDGTTGAWAFVRGSDLGLRVIVDRGTADAANVVFTDASLQNPTRIEVDGSEAPVYGQRGQSGLALRIPSVETVSIVRLERPTAAELGGFEEALDVAGTRQMPVEEILRRHQAFEADQERRLQRYEAIYTQHLRYRPGSGLTPIEVSYRGPFFFRRGEGFDWVWDEFLVNGVRWKDDVPQLPLIQPEKAYELPLEITLGKAYSYTLRGEAVVDGRDTWVVDFEPAELDGAPWQGTVWIDKEIYAKVRSRALQVNLAGDVLSNEETQFFSPVDENGEAAEWSREAYVLPTRSRGQQLQSILNASVQVERETELTGIAVNRGGFEDRLAAAWASDETMLRDTPDGLRYLEAQEDGTRTVQEGFDEDRWFLVGGVYYDDTLDFPLPLAGVNYFSNNFRDSDTQFNFFFAGALMNLNWADPSFFGSRWDAGVSGFGFFFPRTLDLYRDGVEQKQEAVKNVAGRFNFFLGRPLNAYAKLDFNLTLGYEQFSEGDDTAEDFVLPQDTFTTSFATEFSYSRNGWRLGLEGRAFQRSDWEFWGLPGNTEYDPDHESYLKWNASLTKTFWLDDFMKLGVQYEHLGGERLDRFSKYDFDVFSDGSVAGYTSGIVTATRADVVRLDYGFNLGEVIRIGVQGDAAWATDDDTGLDAEFLAGVSASGTVVGPWQTLVNFEVGVPVAGPAENFTARIAFLKLWD
jgi:hypothetical protein